MGAALYLHVPFCRHRCGYCNFPLVAGAEPALIDRYVGALRTHVRRSAEEGPPDGSAEWPRFDSVFVGGGTPTLLDAGVLAGVLRTAFAAFPVASDAEVTVEANPENLSTEYVETLVAAGVNRLSIGAQSFSTRVLDFLDRDHAPDLALDGVAAARAAGVASVSLDLIYGTPSETPEDWRRTLERAVEAAPDHLSCYALTLEPNTPYATRVRRGSHAPPEEDEQAARMEAADHLLHAAGYRRYEVSNWARPGYASRHNLHYWRLGDYLGLGAGAHGHWAGRRWWNLRSPARYARAVEAGQLPTAGTETLDAEQIRTERLLLGLRTTGGVDRAAVEPLADDVVDALASHGLLEADEDRLRLTRGGFALADAITLKLAG